MRYAVATALTSVLVLAFGTAGAWAKGCGGGTKHHGNPSVSQYIEKIPTACGSKSDRGTASLGGQSAQSQTLPLPLPPSVNIQLNRSRQGKQLRHVAASPRFGAPPRSERLTHQQPTSRNALKASVSAVYSGSNGGLIALLVVMAAVALGVVGVAVFRRRAPR